MAIPMTRPIPFADLLGIECLELGDGRAMFAVAVRPELLNSWGVAHGGVTMTLLDIAMSAAGRSLDPERRVGATVELKINFLAPGRGRLTATARALAQGRTLACCDGDVVDEAGTLVARGLATFKFRSAKEPLR